MTTGQINKIIIEVGKRIKVGQRFAFGCNVYTITKIEDGKVRCSCKNAKGEELIIFEMELQHFEHHCEDGIIKLM